MLIASTNKVESDNLKKKLSYEFKMKYLGEAIKILGMEIIKDSDRGEVFFISK